MDGAKKRCEALGESYYRHPTYGCVHGRFNVVSQNWNVHQLSF